MGLFNILDDGIGLEQGSPIIGDQNWNLAIRRNLEKPIRLIAETDKLDVIGNALGFKERGDALNKGADFETDDFHD